MRLKHLRLENVGPFEKAELAPGAAIVVVYGPNGSGKSTLADSLQWCLTGQVRGIERGVPSALIRLGAVEASVEAVFEGDAVVRRKIGPKGSAVVGTAQADRLVKEAAAVFCHAERFVDEDQERQRAVWTLAVDPTLPLEAVAEVVPLEEAAAAVGLPWPAPAGLRLGRGEVEALYKWCVLPGVPVVMADGAVKPIEDIIEGESVLGGTGKPRRVSRIWRLRYCGPVVTLSIRGVPDRLTLTLDHEVLTQAGWRRAAELRVGDRLHDPGVEFVDGGNYLEGWVVGFYAADGCRSEKGTGVRFAVHEREAEHVAAKLRLWWTDPPAPPNGGLRATGPHIHRCGVGRGRMVDVHHPGLVSLVETWVAGKGNAKRLTRFPWERDFAKGVLDGWLEGDGTKDRAGSAAAGRVGSASSVMLAWQMFRLATSMGFATSLTRHRNGESRTPAHHIIVRPVTGHHHQPRAGGVAGLWRRVQKVESRQYEGVVYDLTVDVDHTFLASGVIVSNCYEERAVAARQQKASVPAAPVWPEAGRPNIAQMEQALKDLEAEERRASLAVGEEIGRQKELGRALRTAVDRQTTLMAELPGFKYKTEAEYGSAMERLRTTVATWQTEEAAWAETAGTATKALAEKEGECRRLGQALDGLHRLGATCVINEVILCPLSPEARGVAKRTLVESLARYQAVEVVVPTAPPRPVDAERELTALAGELRRWRGKAEALAVVEQEISRLAKDGAKLSGLFDDRPGSGTPPELQALRDRLDRGREKLAEARRLLAAEKAHTEATEEADLRATRLARLETAVKYLGPKGALAAEMAKTLDALLVRASGFLASWGWQVTARLDPFGLGLSDGRAVGRLSGSERWLVGAALALACAVAVGWKTVVLDGADTLDANNRKGLAGLAEAAAKAGVCVIITALGPPQGTPPPGIERWVIESGQLRRLE